MRYSATRRRFTALYLIGFFAFGCAAGELPPGVVTGDRPMSWDKVDLYIARSDGEAEDYDVRLALNPESEALKISAENDPRLGTYAEVPYSKITSATYSRSEHPRWKSGAGVAVAVGVFAIPVFFMKGKKHWFTIQFEGVEERPENFVYLRLDKDNYRQIIAAFQAQTEVDVEWIEEDA